MFLVGMARFELTTPTSRTWCSTRLSYTPTKARILLTLSIQVNASQSRNAPGGILTAGLMWLPVNVIHQRYSQLRYPEGLGEC